MSSVCFRKYAKRMSEQYIPSVETWWSREWGSEVSAEELVRVQEAEWQARKAAGQIRKSQKTNRQFALMLSFVFKYINDQELLTFLYEQMRNDQISMIALFAIFLPKIREHMDISPYHSLYGESRPMLESWQWSLSHVVWYYTWLLRQFHQLRSIPSEIYTDMIMRWLSVWWVVDLSTITSEELQQIRREIGDEIDNL